MPFCPRTWHLAREGCSCLCSSCLATVITSGTGPRGQNMEQPSQPKHWICLLKVFSGENSEQREGDGMLLYIWQTNYTVINIASLFLWKKKNPCFILRFLVWFILRFRKHKRVRPSRQMHSPWRNAFAVALQQWPREYLQFTSDFFFLLFFSYCLENGPGSRA